MATTSVLLTVDRCCVPFFDRLISSFRSETSANLLLEKVKRDQEEAVSEAVEAVVAGALDFIRDHELKEIVHDHTAAVVTDDITRIYATVDIR